MEAEQLGFAGTSPAAQKICMGLEIAGGDPGGHMSKGKNSKPKIRTIESSEGSVTDPPVRETEGGPGPRKCSACGSWFDLAKTLETRCWLCGGSDFVEPVERELRDHEEKLKRKELCCPAPDCPRQVELLPNSERYCGSCGAALEKATLDVWLHRCVQPELNKDPQLSSSMRSRLINHAWLMGLSREAAEFRLDEEVKRDRSAVTHARTPGESQLRQSVALAADADGASEQAVVNTAKTEGSAVANAGQAGSLPGVSESSRQTENELKQKEKHLRKKIKVKYGVVIGCTLTFFLVLLVIGLWGRSDNLNQNGPSPTPPQPDPPATLEPTPSGRWSGMVFIPGGRFVMGRDRKDGGDAYESPSHEVIVVPFYIDAFEVTREEYQKCVDAKVCRPPFGWTGNLFPPNTGRWPVTGVGWADANDYANWVGKSLPSEEEWEYAATGRQVRRYPWGESWDATQANVGTSSLGAVGSYKSHFGLFDVVGNAQEWTTGGWRQYPRKQAYLKTSDPPERLRVIRGGSYLNSPQEATLTYRNALLMQDHAEENHYEQTGFRCVQHDIQP